MRNVRKATNRAAVGLAAATLGLLTLGAGNAFAGQIKICKQISAGSIDSLRSKQFSFEVRTTHPAHPGPYIVSGIRGGECRLLTNGYFAREIPHIQPNGAPTRATVNEVLTGGFVVQSVTVFGNRGVVTRNCTTNVLTGKQTCTPPHISFDLGPYTNVVTFTNRAAPIFAIAQLE